MDFEKLEQATTTAFDIITCFKREYQKSVPIQNFAEDFKGFALAADIAEATKKPSDIAIAVNLCDQYLKILSSAEDIAFYESVNNSEEAINQFFVNNLPRMVVVYAIKLIKLENQK